MTPFIRTIRLCIRLALRGDAQTSLSRADDPRTFTGLGEVVARIRKPSAERLQKAEVVDNGAFHHEVVRSRRIEIEQVFPPVCPPHLIDEMRLLHAISVKGMQFVAPAKLPGHLPTAFGQKGMAPGDTNRPVMLVVEHFVHQTVFLDRRRNDRFFRRVVEPIKGDDRIADFQIRDPLPAIGGQDACILSETLALFPLGGITGAVYAAGVQARTIDRLRPATNVATAIPAVRSSSPETQ